MKFKNLFFVGENIIIFFFLVLFAAICTILIFFGYDLIFGSYSIIIEEDFSLITYNNNQTSKFYTCLPKEQELNNNKVFIFNPFIDLFNRSHSTYRYYPSYFQILVLVEYKYNISVSENTPCYNLLIIKEVISYNKYLMLEHHNNYLSDVLNDLYKIILDYKQNDDL